MEQAKMVSAVSEALASVGSTAAAAAAAGAQGYQANEADKPQRELTWDECSPEQLVQRLRLEVTLLRELVNSQQAVIDRLKVHGHLQDGRIALPMGMRFSDIEAPRRLLA